MEQRSIHPMSSNQLSQPPFSLAQWLYNSFLQLIIYPSIWVATAVASLGIFTQETLQLGFNWQAIALIFVSALIPYNLDRIFDSYVQKIPEAKAQLFFRQPCIWVLILVAVVATALLLYNAPSSVHYVSIAGIIPLLYGTPLFPWKNQDQWQWYRLKDIPGSKAWIVGGIVTYATIALPLAYAGAKYDVPAALITWFMFVFIVTNCHIFDIRDVASDREKGVVTLPIMVGVQKTKIILIVMNLAMIITIISSAIAGIIAYQPEMIVATVVNLIYIWQINAHTPRWIYSIGIDACLFVPLLTNWVIKQI